MGCLNLVCAKNKYMETFEAPCDILTHLFLALDPQLVGDMSAVEVRHTRHGSFLFIFSSRHPGPRHSEYIDLVFYLHVDEVGSLLECSIRSDFGINNPYPNPLKFFLNALHLCNHN